jgi:hypothetical protein
VDFLDRIDGIYLSACAAQAGMISLLFSYPDHPACLVKFFDLCGYTIDCATHEKEKNYHESTKYRKHEKNISNWIV